MIAGAQPEGGFPAGWYGKLPAAGDFVGRRLPAAFSEPWDRWLQAALAGSQARLGGAWRESFLSMPAWRFVLAPGVLSRQAWAGVMVPSVDAVGRCFPLAVASALPGARLDAPATVLAAESWFESMEAVLVSALAPRADTAAFDVAVLERPFEPDALDEDATLPAAPEAARWSAGGEARAAWLAETSEVFDRTLLVSAELPSAEQYCAMISGRWAQHGWSPARAAAR